MSMPAVVLPTFESCIRLPCNVQGRDFVVGDVHGHFDLIKSLMQQVRFDPALDRLCAVGDLVDRGPQSHTVIEWLNQPWFFSVRGNHEQMVLDHDLGTGEADKHRRNGGSWFHDADLAVRKAVALTLQRLPYVLEIERPNGCIGIVHAEPPLLAGQSHWLDVLRNLSGEQGGDVQQLARRQALYSRSRIERGDESPVQGVEAIYVGHTSVPRPRWLGNVLYLDTGCSWADGRLSAVDVGSGEVFVAEYAHPFG
jgi:serine/threonine protein phosphatase 1